MSETREEVQMADTVKDIAILLSEGNPGALNVFILLLNEEAGGSFLDALHLDDMNIRVTQVWVAYKDFAREDFPTFVKAVRVRDPELIRVVNDAGLRGNHSWKAVPYGASTGNRPTL